MAEELIDILDENGKKTGVSKTKKEAHANGLWHQAAHIWIYNSKGEMLLQKRSKTKDSHPGMWDISVAGHFTAGDTPDMAAMREILEEMGIKVNPEDLKKVMVRKVSKDYDHLNWHNREFDHVYLFKLDLPAPKLKLQLEELEDIKFISLDKLEGELKDPILCKSYVPHGDYYFEIIEIVRKLVKNK